MGDIGYLFFVYLAFSGLLKLYMAKKVARRAILVHDTTYFMNIGDDFTYKRTTSTLLILAVVFLLTSKIAFGVNMIIWLLIFVSFGMIIDILSDYIVWSYLKRKYGNVKVHYLNVTNTIQDMINKLPYDEVVSIEVDDFDDKQIVNDNVVQGDNLLSMSQDSGEFVKNIDKPGKSILIDRFVDEAIDNCKDTIVEVKNLTQSGLLPVNENSIDIVLCRETNFLTHDVFRVLKSDGKFVLIQNAGQHAKELIGLYYPIGMDMGWNLERCSQVLVSEHFEILEKQEKSSTIRFTNMMTLLNFAVHHGLVHLPLEAKNHMPRLTYIYDAIEKHGFYDLTISRFYIVARKGSLKVDA